MKIFKTLVMVFIVVLLTDFYWTVESWYRVFGLIGYFLVGWFITGYYDMKEQII